MGEGSKNIADQPTQELPTVKVRDKYHPTTGASLDKYHGQTGQAFDQIETLPGLDAAVFPRPIAEMPTHKMPAAIKSAKDLLAALPTQTSDTKPAKTVTPSETRPATPPAPRPVLNKGVKLNLPSK